MCDLWVIPKIQELRGVLYWHERATFQRSLFGRLTAGNDVVATIFIRIGTSVRRSSGRRSGGRLLANDIVATISISLFSYFFFPFFFRRFFSLSRPFLQEGLLGSKTYLAKVA